MSDILLDYFERFSVEKKGKVCGKSRAHFRGFLKKENKLPRRILHTKGRFPRKLENHVDFLHAHFGNPRACDQSRFPHFFFLAPCLLWQSPKEARGGGESASKVKNGPPPIHSSPLSSSFACVCGGIRVLCCRPPRLEEEKKSFCGGVPSC